jgi:hypothetical protein
MKKYIAFAFAMTLTAAIQAGPPSRTASTVGKTPTNTNPAAQVEGTSTTPAQTNAGNAAATNGNSSNMVCPPGVKPQSGASNKCFARPTRTVQR